MSTLDSQSSLVVRPDDEAASEMSVTRRALLVSAGGAVASVAVPATGSAHEPTEILSEDAVYGPGIAPLWAVFGDRLNDRTCYVIGRPPRYRRSVAIPVGITDGAILLRDGKAELKDYRRGEELMLGGWWSESGFAALVIEPSYRSLTAQITAIKRRRAETRVETDEGVVRLVSHTKVSGEAPESSGGRDNGAFLARPISRLRRGDWISIIGRRDGTRPELVALQVASRPGP